MGGSLHSLASALNIFCFAAAQIFDGNCCFVQRLLPVPFFVHSCVGYICLAAGKQRFCMAGGIGAMPRPLANSLRLRLIGFSPRFAGIAGSSAPRAFCQGRCGERASMRQSKALGFLKALPIASSPLCPCFLCAANAGCGFAPSCAAEIRAQ